MTIYSVTDKYDRRRIRLTREGVEFRLERPAVGGGYYVRELLVAPWPWKKDR